MPARSAMTMTRRDLLRAGSAGLLGLFAPELLRAASGAPRARAKAVIFLHQYGGPSHLDTFDMKPSATERIRGELQPIATRVPGLQVCDRLPRTAAVMDRVTL